MKTAIIRTGSGSFRVWNWSAPGSPRISVLFPVQEFEKKSGCSPPCISLRMEDSRRSIRRVSSEPGIIRSGMEGLKSMSKLGSRSSAARIPEEEDHESSGSLNLTESPIGDYAGDWPRCAIPLEETGFPGGGIRKNWNSGEGGKNEFGSGGKADRSKIGAYYEEMIKSNPNNSLLLRNYGKYLHEVEGDCTKAEEYYGRAILENPGDGEVLSLYGKLIWEKERDGRRAKSYFDQAVQVAPDDCTVLGSYAHFMWETEDQDDDDVDEFGSGAATMKAVVEAF